MALMDFDGKSEDGLRKDAKSLLTKNKSYVVLMFTFTLNNTYRYTVYSLSIMIRMCNLKNTLLTVMLYLSLSIKVR